MSLLEQSHDVSRQLPLGTRLSLLERQVQMVSQWQPDLAREWAYEMFTLSFETKGTERLVTQNNAIAALARFDAEHALGLLHSMSVEESDGKPTTRTLRTQAARSVFGAFAERDGEPALPLLEQEAAGLAAEGQYPYSALGYAVSYAIVKGWPGNRERAASVIQEFLNRALTRYSLGSHSYQDDLEFGHMLQAVAGFLPPESARPAVRLLVKNLLATDLTKNRYQAERVTNEGQLVKTDNAIDSALLLFGPMISRNDPELAEELQSTRPQLKVGLSPSGSMTIGAAPTRPPDPNVETRSDALRLSYRNPDAAIAKARQLPEGDMRVATLLDVARGIAGDHSEQAAQLIAEAQPPGKTADDALQLNIIAAQVSVAAAQSKTTELRELLQRGFDLANRVIWRSQGKSNSGYPGLVPLVQIGVQNEPDMTVNFIQGLPAAPFLRANLLLGAAAAVGMSTRLPLSLRPQDKGGEAPQ